MSIANQHEIIRFAQDMTLRWPCRRGDFILWMGYADIFGGPESIKIHDLWEMRDGYHVTDYEPPRRFPRVVRTPSDRSVQQSRAKDGGQNRGGPLSPRAIRRAQPLAAQTGDRVAWVGAERPERLSVSGILAILDCRECALAVGEGDRGGLEEFVGSGAPTTPDIKPEDAARCRAAVEVVKQLGLPRSWDPEWRLG